MPDNIGDQEHRMEESLQRGNAGEEAFYQEFIGIVEWHEARDGDFTIGPHKIELKSDSRPTGNLFIERYSNYDAKTPGGPWQAVVHGCDFFISHYQSNGTLYIFDPHTLSEYVGENYKTIAIASHRDDGFYVKNKTWWTWGHAIPISELMCVCLDVWPMKRRDIFEDEKRKFWQSLIKKRFPIDI